MVKRELGTRLFLLSVCLGNFIIFNVTHFSQVWIPNICVSIRAQHFFSTSLKKKTILPQLSFVLKSIMCSICNNYHLKHLIYYILFCFSIFVLFRIVWFVSPAANKICFIEISVSNSNIVFLSSSWIISNILLLILLLFSLQSKKNKQKEILNNFNFFIIVFFCLLYNFVSYWLIIILFIIIFIF